MQSRVKAAIEGRINVMRERVFGAIDRLFFFGEHKDDVANARKVLVVRLDAIGDFIIWVDAANALRQLYPQGQYHLTLLGNELWAPIAADLGVFDEVWALNRRRFSKSLRYRASWLWRVSRGRFSVAIHPTYSREFTFGDTLVRASRAPERIGSGGNAERDLRSGMKKISDRWYTRLIPATPQPLMELIRNAEFIRGLGLPEYKAAIPRLPVVATAPMTIENYYVLVPGAGTKNRQWPIERFGAVAERIHQATGWTGVVSGGPGDALLGDALLASTNAPLQNWAGKTSLQELIATIAGARLVVTNDTSAVHIATAVSVPSVCIVGGGHPGRFVPYHIETEKSGPLPVICSHPMDCFGCNWRCPHCPTLDTVSPCIAGVTVDDVWKAVSQVISEVINDVQKMSPPVTGEL